jgi:NitT/TauT family transport system substrate-binding protein
MIPMHRGRIMNLTTFKRLLFVLYALSACHSALAEDTLKLAIGQRGNWENAAPELGQKAGFFKKRGLNLELLYTQGAGETLQAVISGSVDLGVGVGTAGVLGAFAKGAPVRAIANSMTGADDLFWYVPAASPIKSIKDANGKTIAYSTNGSSTNLAVLAFNREFGAQAKPVATGSPSSTFTQTMTGQVDIGWSAPPFGIADLQQGRIRIIVRESDVPAFRNQTVRLMIANTATAEQRGDAIDRFLQAYRETLDWMYADPAALKAYAEWVGIAEALAKEIRDQFYPRENLRLDRLSGLDEAMADAVSLKFLPAPLTKPQIDELFKYYARGAK